MCICSFYSTSGNSIIIKWVLKITESWKGNSENYIPVHRVEFHVQGNKVPSKRYQFEHQLVQCVLKCIPSVIINKRKKILVSCCILNKDWNGFLDCVKAYLSWLHIIMLIENLSWICCVEDSLLFRHVEFSWRAPNKCT